jgi:chromate reductase, NAD(P)H dehydrogenase (quinone)
VNLAAMNDFDAPSYDADMHAVEGFPVAAEELRDRIAASDALMIASREYNFSMPGSLKHSIDWVSRFSPQPLNERHGLLMSGGDQRAPG